MNNEIFKSIPPGRSWELQHDDQLVRPEDSSSLPPQEEYIFVPKKRQRRESSIRKNDIALLKKMEQKYTDCVKSNIEYKQELQKYKFLSQEYLIKLESARQRIKYLEDYISKQEELEKKAKSPSLSYREAKGSIKQGLKKYIQPIKMIKF